MNVAQAEFALDGFGEQAHDLEVHRPEQPDQRQDELSVAGAPEAWVRRCHRGPAHSMAPGVRGADPLVCRRALVAKMPGSFRRTTIDAGCASLAGNDEPTVVCRMMCVASSA